VLHMELQALLKEKESEIKSSTQKKEAIAEKD
jgi:hypothetical protein